MPRVRLASALLGVVLVAGACSAGEELPGADELREIDTSPSQVFVINGSSPTSSLQISTGEVLAIRNDDNVDHRLTGVDFDTGTLRPGDETLVLFEEPTEIEWTDLLSDESGTITVLASDQG